MVEYSRMPVPSLSSGCEIAQFFVLHTDRFMQLSTEAWKCSPQCVSILPKSSFGRCNIIDEIRAVRAANSVKSSSNDMLYVDISWWQHGDVHVEITRRCADFPKEEPCIPVVLDVKGVWSMYELVLHGVRWSRWRSHCDSMPMCLSIQCRTHKMMIAWWLFP